MHDEDYFFRKIIASGADVKCSRPCLGRQLFNLLRVSIVARANTFWYPIP